MFIPLKDYNPTRRPALVVAILILINFSGWDKTYYRNIAIILHTRRP